MRLGRVVVIVPTYNESNNLSGLIGALENSFKDIDIDSSVIIVDDDSPDGTGEIAEDLAIKYGNIIVLHRNGKLGLGSAYKDGFTYALDNLKADIIVQMDADNSHDPRYLHDMLKIIREGKDVVVGSRRVDHARIEGWGSYRESISFIANTIARLTCGISIRDVTSGYRAFTSCSLRRINMKDIQSNGYAFQIEMLYHIEKSGFDICELPITFVDRREGKSKLSLHEVLEFLGACTRIMFSR